MGRREIAKLSQKCENSLNNDHVSKWLKYLNDSKFPNFPTKLPDSVSGKSLNFSLQCFIGKMWCPAILQIFPETNPVIWRSLIVKWGAEISMSSDEVDPDVCCFGGSHRAILYTVHMSIKQKMHHTVVTTYDMMLETKSNCVPKPLNLLHKKSPNRSDGSLIFHMTIATHVFSHKSSAFIKILEQSQTSREKSNNNKHHPHHPTSSHIIPHHPHPIAVRNCMSCLDVSTWPRSAGKC